MLSSTSLSVLHFTIRFIIHSSYFLERDNAYIHILFIACGRPIVPYICGKDCLFSIASPLLLS